MEHGLIMDYPILNEKAGEFVAQFKGTVVVQPKSVAILCGGGPLHGADGYVSDKTIKDEYLKALIAKDLWKKPEVKKEKTKK
jgi:NAD(P)H-hydrate repair Nnr-like enzyme with NAD(P)H-hydrate epimerase domain